jgi:hypothetical protein
MGIRYVEEYLWQKDRKRVAKTSLSRYINESKRGALYVFWIAEVDWNVLSDAICILRHSAGHCVIDIKRYGTIRHGLVTGRQYRFISEEAKHTYR